MAALYIPVAQVTVKQKFMKERIVLMFM